jgi:ABC-type transporter Mla subunit MlaD
MALPFPLDPRLVMRALDDLHAIAVAARALPQIEARLTEQMTAVDRRGGEILEAIDRADARAAGLMKALDRIDRDMPSLAEAVDSIRSLEAATKTLAAAVEPLQGTAERLGRISDRLTGRRG